ncbi:MAG: hypothetical protein AW12_00849 [Candidatus Accumulibacter sp. BA-94]|uniref:hypothetical protein n=1 Tax=Accumulibacter sp. TaxID=2053492 RepID=UPI000445467D|nr:hypothetical protein [Accumulibacter sp.]EXI92106.1 MAG: hypothetical protein AW12_00849 [Candidatus Accumulibacter sp. BA-94]HRD86793.1 hypothetical protein [Accumulibacter sp.]
MPKKLIRTIHLACLFALAEFLEVFAVVYLPLRSAWMWFWGTWARFWCAVRLWRFMGYCWGAAWRTSSYLMEDEQ